MTVQTLPDAERSTWESLSGGKIPFQASNMAQSAGGTNGNWLPDAG
jgi:hypothetical protein